MISNYHNIFTNKTYSQTNYYADLSETLSHYLQEEESIYGWKYEAYNYDSTHKVAILTYILHSQTWPKDTQEIFSHNIWKHKLVIYKPDVIEHHSALLFINGGYTTDKEGKPNFQEPKEKPSFLAIAQTNKAIVAEIQNVPNQYLFFDCDNKSRKEDEILAYSYKNVLNDPHKNAYWAGHLPMAKAATKAMDAIQEILGAEYRISIDDFVIAGASKRGWAAWLTALGDERVSALIPIVVDILNVQKNIKHICAFYKTGCPLALKDYVAEGIIEQLERVNTNELMKIEDPLSYNNSQMLIPKYIINSGGDDFSVPDSSSLYFKQLPGNNNIIRYVPNSSHYVSNDLISKVLNTYFYIFLNCYQIPKLNWHFQTAKFQIFTSQKPLFVKLWVAENPETPDFRFNKYPEGGNIRYQDSEVTHDCKNEQPCTLEVPLPSLEKGWQAAFVEFGYEIGNQTLVLTTEIKITPEVNF